MGILSNQLKAGAIGSAIQSSNDAMSTIAKVTEVNKTSNTCTVEYINGNGQKTTSKDAFVDMRNTDWFPKVNDCVLIKITGNSILVESQYTQDYAKDIMKKSKLKNDTTPDSDGTCGGNIM